MKLIALFAALCVHVACSDHKSLSAPSKIIDQNDLVLVAADGGNVPEQFVSRLSAFAHILPVGCTGTHIGGGIVLTAGHCVNGAQGHFERREAFACDGVNLEFGKLQGSSPAPIPCLEWVAAEFTAERDYAYLRIAAEDAPPAAFTPAADRVATGTELTIFGHPAMRALSWSGVCIARAHEEGVGSLDRLTYACDTEGGSSGSAVLNMRTDEVVAVHDGAGDSDQPWNYSTYLDAAPLSD